MFIWFKNTLYELNDNQFIDTALYSGIDYLKEDDVKLIEFLKPLSIPIDRLQYEKFKQTKMGILLRNFSLQDVKTFFEKVKNYLIQTMSQITNTIQDNVHYSFLKFLMIEFDILYPDNDNIDILKIDVKNNIFIIKTLYKNEINFLSFFYDSGKEEFVLLEQKTNKELEDQYPDDDYTLSDVDKLFYKYYADTLGEYQLTILEKLQLKNIVKKMLKETNNG